VKFLTVRENKVESSVKAVDLPFDYHPGYGRGGDDAPEACAGNGSQSIREPCHVPFKTGAHRRGTDRTGNPRLLPGSEEKSSEYSEACNALSSSASLQTGCFADMALSCRPGGAPLWQTGRGQKHLLEYSLLLHRL